jgi:hypothetical protein
MSIFIGTDEAGYGPSLGPLVISATVWETPYDLGDEDLYRVLNGIATADIRRKQRPGELTIADSKSLYTPAVGLARLERNLLPALTFPGATLDTWRQLWQQLVPGVLERMRGIPWYADFDRSLPVAAQPTDLAANDGWRQGLLERGVRLAASRAAAAFPGEFNASVRQAGSKGAVLSRMTLELIAGLLEPLGEQSVLIHCDKHGGRNRYLPALQEVFPETAIRVQQESRAISSYCWGTGGRQTEIRFVAKGERFLPAALASMISKYLRELAMSAFNTFWIAQCPGLKPTAGYPVDAKRFLRAIAAIQERLAIPREILWRER